MKAFKIITTTLVLIGGLIGCQDLGELNIDPTTSAVPDAKSLISTVQVRHSGDRETTWRTTFGYHMSIMQMISDGWTGAHGQVYLKDPFYFEYLWRTSYRNINDLQIAINASTESSDVNYKSVARILKVMIFANLTDSFGNIPYFDAVNGHDGVMFPAYDEQEDIYTDFFVELAEAEADLDESLSLNGDLIFDGDVSKWKKFANSLRLRYAMRLVNVNEPKAQTEAAAAINAGVMTSIDDAAFVQHGAYDVSLSGATEIRGNAFSQLQLFPEQITVGCDTYVGYMRDNADPRMRMLFGMYGAELSDATTNEKYKSVTSTSVEITDEYLAKYGSLNGFPAGYYLFDPTENTTPAVTWTPFTVDKDGETIQITKYFKSMQINRELTRLDMPAMYQSYGEVELWLAEIAARGWGLAGVSSAQQHFENAVNAGVEELEVIMGSREPTSSVSDYIATVWGSASDLEVINMQHYMNNFYNPSEGYANWRRSGYPELVAAQHNSSDAALSGLIPRKFPYPDTEMNYNRANLEPHLDDGVNFWGAPVWWDGSLDRGVQ